MLLDLDSEPSAKTTLPTASAVEADLADIMWRLDKSTRAAIDDFLTNHASQRHYISPRTQSSLIHDLIVQHVKAEFEPDKDIQVTKGHGTHEILVRDKYRFRMKKLDKKFFTKNIPTQMALEFRGQIQLPGMEIWNLVLGYLPPKEEVGMLSDSRIYIAMPNGKRNAWEKEITNLADEKLPTVAVNDQEAPAPKQRAGIRIKKDVAGAKGDNNDAAAGDKK